jgi:type II secretory pathway predicted ATPase ExeA
MSRYRAFGLNREPFAPEPELAMMAPALGQTDALARLRQAAIGRAGLALVAGERGIGKSMVRLAIARDLRIEPSIMLAELTEPAEWRTDVTFLRAVASAFGIDVSGRTTLDLTTDLQKGLGAVIEDDVWPLLIVDDAHRLTSSQIDLVRSLLGPDDRAPRLSVMLFGAPEIEERIGRRQALTRHLAMRHTLNPLNATDAAGLLAFRLKVAGQAGGDELFSNDAVTQLVERSGGNPGALVAIAAAAIDQGASTRTGTIDREIVHTVAQQLMLGDRSRDAGERGTGISTPGSGKR